MGGLSMSEPKRILDADGIDRTIRDMASRVAECVAAKDAVIIGVRTHGVTIAKRLREALAREHGWDVPFGILDITFYRDDLQSRMEQPVAQPTQLDFDVTGRDAILVDDVLFTGRTARCALDEIMDFGRPRTVRLAVLVDRGHRELPIQADFVGLRIDTRNDQIVGVEFRKPDGQGEDAVWVRDASRTTK
jgi:pyrimidine operon attenuation protein/uracil phosphoribosyltransferase